MKETQVVTLMRRALDAGRSIERTMRGARPAGRRLARRFRHLTAPAREAVTVTTTDEEGKTRKEHVRLSRAGRAGLLTQLAHDGLRQLDVGRWSAQRAAQSC